MQTKNIDILKLAEKVAQKPIELISSMRISKDTMLYRFGNSYFEDELHILTDGCGGYTAINEPASEKEKILKGSLSDFEKELKCSITC